MDCLKLQFTVGDIEAFDCRGGEPDDFHRTIAEIDPATPEAIALASQLRDLLNRLQFQPSKNLRVPGVGTPRLQVRLMDGDART